MSYPRILLKLATGHGILIGLYHIILPYQWDWSRFTQELPPIIEWSLFALNMFFSVLLILLSALGGMVPGLCNSSEQAGKLIFGAIILFWGIDIGYQLLNPVPAPNAYWFIRPLFLGAAIVNFSLYVVVLRSFMGNRRT